jgi:hypothetical protein
MTSENRNVLFAGVPRRSRIGGAMTIAAWLVLCGAFITDAIPTRPAEQWLYDMEATREGYARALANRDAPVRRAARTPPRAERAATVLSAATAVPTALAATPEKDAGACGCP